MRGRGPAPETYAPRGLLVDRFGRRLRYLRVSVTDRCNYRCRYCMPAEGVKVHPKTDLLTQEEIARVARLACEMGFDKVRLTGGEPTLRRDIIPMISALAATPGLRDLSMTTNGATLDRRAQELRDAGLKRLNLSLDTLDPERYRELTRGAELAPVLAGIDKLLEMDWTPVKLNMVVMRGVNEDDPLRMVERYADAVVDVRFIEYMPFGSSGDEGVPWAETQAQLERRFTLEPDGSLSDGGPATRFRIVGHSCRVATISAMSRQFCNSCNRIRISSSGYLRTCLATGTPSRSIRELLRSGADDDELEAAIRAAVASKPRGYRQLDGGDRAFSGPMSRIGG